METNQTASIGIRKWAGSHELHFVAEAGDGDRCVAAWQRGDGALAIETNGDPIFEHEPGFYEAWELVTA